MGAVGGQSRERLPLHNEEGTKEKKSPGAIETQQSLASLLHGKRPALSQHGASIVRSAELRFRESAI